MTVVDHPVAQHLLSVLRDRQTEPPLFRTIAKRLTIALVLEAVRGLPTVEVGVQTPLEHTTGRQIHPDLVAVPILRAGLGMLEAVTELFPEVSVGYVGLERDERTLLPTHYYQKFPALRGRHVLLLDPMLATGGSAAAACSGILERGPAALLFVCVVAAPEGVARLERDYPSVSIFTASLDRGLTDNGYILPGLGDFGDRLYGTEPQAGVPSGD